MVFLSIPVAETFGPISQPSSRWAFSASFKTPICRTLSTTKKPTRIIRLLSWIPKLTPVKTPSKRAGTRSAFRIRSEAVHTTFRRQLSPPLREIAGPGSPSDKMPLQIHKCLFFATRGQIPCKSNPTKNSNVIYQELQEASGRERSRQKRVTQVGLSCGQRNSLEPNHEHLALAFCKRN